jgi:hypothetical protein
MAIRLTFFTPSDDFRGVARSAEDWRAWLRNRGRRKSVITHPDGTQEAGPTVDDVGESDLARWVAATALKEAMEKARGVPYINVHRDEGVWVSIRADLIEAIEAEVVEDSDAGADESEAAWPFAVDDGQTH